MSIERIGNADAGMNIDQYRQASRKQQPEAPAANGADAVYKPSGDEGTTKVNYPPFLPVGDTQGIYKK